MVNCKRHYVEIGRVIFVRMGKYRNTLAVITDVIDHNWVVADGRAFEGGMVRGCVNIKDLALTHLKLKMGHGLCHRRLKELVAKGDIVAKWNKTLQAKKLADVKAKRNAVDLERWRVQYNRRQRSWLIKAKYGKLKQKALQTAKRLHGPKNPIKFAERKNPALSTTRKNSKKLTGAEKKIKKAVKLNYKNIAGYN